MPQLGATLEDLDRLATRLNTSAGAMATENGNVVNTTNAAVADLNTGSTTAMNNINTFMGNLEADVLAVVGEATSTDWTGQNREAFVGNYEQFKTQMDLASGATAEYYGTLQSTIAGMMEELRAYQQQFSTALSAAQTASESMATAVNGQRQNLSDAMNTGMNFG